jgi:hypothetical protein
MTIEQLPIPGASSATYRCLGSSNYASGSLTGVAINGTVNTYNAYTGSLPAFNFTAPADGIIVVELDIIAVQTASRSMNLSFALSGASALAAADSRSVQVVTQSTTGAYPHMHGKVYVSGLTPGGAYTLTPNLKADNTANTLISASVAAFGVA